MLDENSEERRGSMKIMSKGSRFCNAAHRFWGPSCALSFASRGLRRGLLPPNWCTLIPGPPPRLKTNCGPVSKPNFRQCCCKLL